MPPDEQPRNLKAMLSEAKDTSELMVDLAYAARFFGDAQMADEVHEPEERLADLARAMPEVWVLRSASEQVEPSPLPRFAALGGYRMIEDDATGEIALVRVDS